MKESYKEDLANHFGHESYADDGNVVGVATAVVYAGKQTRRDTAFFRERLKGTQLFFGGGSCILDLEFLS